MISPSIVRVPEDDKALREVALKGAGPILALTYISLFSGIGGIDLGFDRAGWECLAQVEKDPYCQRVLAKHWPNVPRFDDIRTFNRESINGAVDIVAGGFPCQPFSNAGKQRGSEDDRHLWPEMLRIVQEFKPSWVIGENTPGLIGLFLEEALSDLEGAGYEAWAFVLPAVAFDAPHRRDRLFLIAHLDCHGELQPQGGLSDKWGWANNGNSETMGGRAWPPEPRVGRMVYGVSHRLDRLRGLGNAVVPAIAEHIALCISSLYLPQRSEL